MKKLFRFAWAVKRGGRVEGTFVADESEVAAAIGKDVYFGEILGKHSEVRGTLDLADVVIITDDQEFIAKAETYGIASTGYNPLRYIGLGEED